MVYLDRKHPNPPLFGRTAEEAGRIFQCISAHGIELISWLEMQGFERKGDA